MKFSPNIKIPDSLKRVLKRESTPDPLREPKRPIRRNPKDNIPLNFRERSNARLSLIASIVVLAILVLFFNQLDYRLIRKPAIDARKKATISKEKQETTTASVIAVGDNLYHQSLIDAGASSDGNWNYDKIYTHIQDAIKDADIKMIDQETVFTTDHDSVSSYPSFATPTEVGDAIIKAGFNVVESANNHIDDFGEGFLTDTLNFWKTTYPDVTLLGIHDSQEDADTVKIREVNGIKIAFLDYTYGTNNSGAGEGKDYMIDIFDKDKITTMIQKAKSICDCLIFVAHWGTEDETMPNEYEKQWAAFLMEQGVDVVIGTNPNVLQPYGYLTDDAGHNMLIYYSLGNFVTGQETLKQLLGGMATFTIQKTVEGDQTTIEIQDAALTPLVMHYSYDTLEYAPYKLDDYTDALASAHSVRQSIGDEFSLENLQTKYDEIMSMNVTPSTKTDLLDVTFDSDGNMLDSNGNYVEDNDSITSSWYYQTLATQSSSSSDGSGSDSSDASDDNSEG